jgi:hypothetical protein
MDTQNAVGGGISTVIILLVLGYFLPTIIALLRKHSDAPAIVAVNIFLGWSVIGWFVAFIWALSDPRGRGNQTVVVNTTQHVGPAYPIYQPNPDPEPHRIVRSTPAPLPRAAARPAITSDDADTAFWDGMRDKSDPDLLEEYLIRFPFGRFTQLARSRLVRAGMRTPSAANGSAPPAAGPQTLLPPPRSPVCARCGATWEADSRFCSECGSARESGESYA